MSDEKRAQENEYEKIIDVIGSPIFIIDKNGTYQMANKAFYEGVGLNTDDVIGKKLWDIFPKSGADERFKAITEVIQTKKEKNIEVQVLRQGEICYFLTNIRPFGENVLCTSKDITIRKHAEQALQKNEERFNKIINSTPDFVVETDLMGFITYANKAGIELIEYQSIDELLGKNMFDFVAQEDLPYALKNMDLMQEEPLGPKEYYIITRSGKKVPVELNGDLLRDTEGNPTGIVQVGRVITARKLTEQKLLDEIYFRKTIFQNMPAFLVMIDNNGKTIEMNESLLHALQYTETEIKGTDYLNTFVPEEERDKLAQVFQKLTQDNVQTFNENYIVAKDGTRILVEWHGMPVFKDGDFDYFIGFGLDITEKRKNEEMALVSEKLRSLSVLGGGIAHDFNNLLTVILGNEQTALLKKTPDEIHDQLRKNNQAFDRLISLTQELLTFTKEDHEPNKSTYSLKVLLKKTAELHLSGTGIKVEYEFPDDPLMIEINADQIRRVLQNLINNFKDIKMDGAIMWIKAKKINLDRIEFSIKDNGPGVPYDIQSKIFDPFFTTKKKTGGTGLGLSNCHKIITNHNGSITVESSPHLGTEFKVTLPIGNISREEVKEKQDKTIMKTDKPCSILALDDEENILAILTELLEPLGYNIVTATSGKDGVKIYSDAFEKSPFDIVITDMTFKEYEFNGEKVLEELQKINPDVKVILTTGWSDGDSIAKFKKKGFKAVLSKPFSTGTIVTMLANLLA